MAISTDGKTSRSMQSGGWYAGMLDGANRWLAGTNINLAIQVETIQTRQWYELEVILSGDTATPQVGGVTKVSQPFASKIDGGLVGLPSATIGGPRLTAPLCQRGSRCVKVRGDKNPFALRLVPYVSRLRQLLRPPPPPASHQSLAGSPLHCARWGPGIPSGRPAPRQARSRSAAKPSPRQDPSPPAS
jgi:hypothetical protein